MASPIILSFGDSESLTSINSIVVGGGVSWGKATIPLTPLNFSKENFKKEFLTSDYPEGISNKDFFNTFYSLAVNKSSFWDKREVKERPVKGVAVGLSEAGVFSTLANGIEAAIAKLAGKIVGKALAGVTLDGLQVSTSSRPLLHGMNGKDTFNFELNDIRNDLNVCIMQASAGCVVGTAINMAFFGPFKSTGVSDFTVAINFYQYLWQVYNSAIAWANVFDAAVGVILPGVQFQIIAS